MSINTSYRTDQTEIMDDFQLEGFELQDALDKIAKINQLLGGNSLTLQGLKTLLVSLDKTPDLTIVDIGCGNGDMLRYISEFGENEGYNFKLIGIDANAFTIQHAQKLSNHYPNISYQCQDIFDESFSELKYDIVFCTLTLHHFKNEEIVDLIKTFYNNCTVGIVINDLHRSKIAYKLFQAVCWLFKLNRMSREDGLVSILRGFKKEDLLEFSLKLGFKKYSIQWKWAFRYQWIIKR